MRKQSFTRRDYKDYELKKLQKTELEILCDVIRICDENNIQYFTVGGTTLGAIRHNGFIPWDDDIDIGMLREDYERFIRIAPQELKKGYTLSHFLYEPTSPTYYAKVRKDGTEFVEGYTRNIQMHHGIFIDIMPYDKIPENEVERRRYRKRVKIWNQLYIAKTVWTSTFLPSRHKMLLNCIRAFLHVLMAPVPKHYLYRKTDEAMRAYNESTSHTVSSRALPVFDCKIESLLPAVNHTFESINVKIPADADQVLKTQYGDYMKLPPLEKQYSHAPVYLKL